MLLRLRHLVADATAVNVSRWRIRILRALGNAQMATIMVRDLAVVAAKRMAFARASAVRKLFVVGVLAVPVRVYGVHELNKRVAILIGRALEAVQVARRRCRTRRRGRCGNAHSRGRRRGRDPRLQRASVADVVDAVLVLGSLRALG